MKHFRMEINSGMLPQLFLDFGSDSNDMATTYAKRISRELALTKWGHFVLWHVPADNDAARVAEWTVTSTATVQDMS